MYYPVEYKDCHDSGMNIIEEIAQYYNQTKDINQGYYTKDPKKAFFSVLEDHIFSKAQHIGRDTINEKKFY